MWQPRPRRVKSISVLLPWALALVAGCNKEDEPITPVKMDAPVDLRGEDRDSAAVESAPPPVTNADTAIELGMTSIDADAVDGTSDATVDRPTENLADASTSDATPDAGADATPEVGSADAWGDGAPVGPALPVLTTLTPAMGAGGTPLTLNLSGFNFPVGMVVLFGGREVPTTRSSDTLARAQLSAAIATQPGLHAVWIERRSAGVTTSSNVLYFSIPAPMGAPEVVDYTSDNGVAGDRIRIIGRNLTTPVPTVADTGGRPAVAGAAATLTWAGASLESLEITIPASWRTGPLTVTNPAGSFRGKIFYVQRNLTKLPGTSVTASSHYNDVWTIARGADNDLGTSWFSKAGECATAPACTSVPWFQVTLPAPQTLAHLALRGNREYLTGYDFIRGRFEVLGSSGALLFSRSIALPLPDRDLDVFFPTPLTQVTSVRFTSEQDESNDPGLAELELFAP